MGEETVDDEDSNKQILDELKKQTRLYQKWSQRGIIVLIIFCIVLLSFSYFRSQKTQKSQKEPRLSWDQVIELTDKGSYDEAEKIALNLAQKTPTDYYPQACLARLYLRKGDLTKAIKHAEVAYRLFPDKYNSETLQALKKRLESGQ